MQHIYIVILALTIKIKLENNNNNNPFCTYWFVQGGGVDAGAGVVVGGNQSLTWTVIEQSSISAQ